MTAKKLTSKQLHFCRCVPDGQSQAQAYREAYNVSETTKPATTHEAASRLMRVPEIRARVEYLIRQKEAGLVASAVSDREKVLSKLRHLLDHAEPSDSAKLRAAELLGKSVGLFKDVVESTVTDRSSDDLLSDLERLLESSSEQAEPRPTQEPLH